MSVMKLPIALLAVLMLSSADLTAQTIAPSAQRKAITKKDFQKVDEMAKQLLAATPYRVTYTSEVFSENEAQPFFVTKTIEEYVPPDRRHQLREDTNRGTVWKGEVIVIGSRKFRKKDDGRWEETSWEEYVFFKVVKTQYFSYGTVQLDGKQAEVFAVIERIKDRAFKDGRNKDVFFTLTTTNWYDTEGRLLKVLGEINNPAKESSWTKLYDYDPTIKIEAPIN